MSETVRPQMLGIAQAAKESNVSRYTLTIWAHEGKICAVRVGGSRGRILINMDSLYNFLSTATLTDSSNSSPLVKNGIKRIGGDVNGG